MTAATWRAGALTDTGLQRSINEDRIFVDESRGLFLVVDGLGGHAAGETAAQTAVDVIGQHLLANTTIDERKIRLAITAANNEIYRKSEANPEFHGMACVLTLAAAVNDHFLIGHVGDSRMYTFWNGKLQKVTCDHSPVGELEDAGELTEEEAMHHPRRNEVFRDVGSFQHQADDPQFIEIKRLPFHADAALLLCSDGLSDIVNSAEIVAILERYDGDALRIARLLIDAANAAGGRDNISAIFVPGPAFLGTQSAALSEGRSRHGTTRMRAGQASGRGIWRNLFLLFLGMVLGLGLWLFYVRYQTPPSPPPAPVVIAHIPREIPVNPADSLGLIKALTAALAGDTIAVPAGEYLGPLQLKDHVNIVAQVPHSVVVRSDPASTVDPGVAVIARDVKEARLKGLQISGDDTHPLRVGLLIANSSIEGEDLEISGAIDAGMRVEGDSHPLIVGSLFHSNAGPGVTVRGHSAPKLVGNRITENGLLPQSRHAGIEVDNEAQPSLLHNDILKNGLPAVFPLALDQDIRANNSVDKAPAPVPAKPHLPAAKPKPSAKPASRPPHPLTEV